MQYRSPLIEKMVDKSPSERQQIILKNYRESLFCYSTPEDSAIAFSAIVYAFDQILRSQFYKFFAYPNYEGLSPSEINELCQTIQKNEIDYIENIYKRKGVKNQLQLNAIEQRDKIIDENRSGYKCPCGLLYATPPDFIIKLCVGCAREVSLLSKEKVIESLLSGNPEENWEGALARLFYAIFVQSSAKDSAIAYTAAFFSLKEWFGKLYISLFIEELMLGNFGKVEDAMQQIQLKGTQEAFNNQTINNLLNSRDVTESILNDAVDSVQDSYKRHRFMICTDCATRYPAVSGFSYKICPMCGTEL